MKSDFRIIQGWEGISDINNSFSNTNSTNTLSFSSEVAGKNKELSDLLCILARHCGLSGCCFAVQQSLPCTATSSCCLCLKLA